MPEINLNSLLLKTFKLKIEESLTMVPNMVPEEKLEAAQFWNRGCTKMQEMMNEYAEEICAQQIEQEKENAKRLASIGTTAVPVEKPKKSIRREQTRRPHKQMENQSCSPKHIPYPFTAGNEEPSSCEAESIIPPRNEDSVTVSNLNGPNDKNNITSGEPDANHNTESIENCNWRTSQNDNVGAKDAEVQMKLKKKAPFPRAIFVCTVCKAQFPQRRFVVEHFRIHTGEKPFECQHCGKKFMKKRGMLLHSRWHSTERPWQCEQCGKCFCLKRGLKRHLMIHTGERPYKCNVCDKRFIQWSTWKTHKVQHERVYKCANCEEKCSTRLDLKVHMKNSQCMYQCPECPAKFFSKGIMENHLKSHTGEIRFVCERCGKGFASQRNLAHHTSKNCGIQRYTCDICDEVFGRKNSLDQHRQKHETSGNLEDDASVHEDQVLKEDSVNDEQTSAVILFMPENLDIGENRVVVVLTDGDSVVESMPHIESLTVE